MINLRWWSAPASKDKNDPNPTLAKDISTAGGRIETSQVQRRWRSLQFYRFYSGRNVLSQFAYGIAHRPMSFLSTYGNYEFQPLSFNIIAEAGEVYINRLLRQQVFLSIIPERGNYKQRQLSKSMEMWVDGGFETTGFWDLYTQMGIDAIIYGSGIIKWAKTLDGKPGCFLVHQDELLPENMDDPNPKSMIQRVWANRQDIQTAYGTTQVRMDALEKATAANPAFYFDGSLDCSEIIPLFEGWRLPQLGADGTTKIKGRHVLCVNNVTLLDEEYEDDELPFVKWDFKQLPGSYFGKGLAETLLPIAEELDRLLQATQECMYGFAWPRWLVEEHSGVLDSTLSNTPGAIIKYVKTPPQMITPESINPEVGHQLERLKAWGLEQAHISLQAVKGETPGGLSGIALEKYRQIDDANFAEMAQRLESFVKKCGLWLIKLGKECKSEFTLPGRNIQLIKWSDVKIVNDRPFGLQAFGQSRLPQTPSGRQVILDNLLSLGMIDKKVYCYFMQVPDIDQLLDTKNAPIETVNRLIDELIISDDYIPPSPFMDLEYAKSQIEARIDLEDNWGLPQNKMDHLFLWRSAVLEMIDEKADIEQAKPGVPLAPGGQATPGPAAVQPGAGFGDSTTGIPQLSPDEQASLQPVSKGN